MVAPSTVAWSQHACAPRGIPLVSLSFLWYLTRMMLFWIPVTPYLHTPSFPGSPEAAHLQLWLPFSALLGASADCFGVPPLAQIGGNYGLKEVQWSSKLHNHPLNQPQLISLSPTSSAYHQHQLACCTPFSLLHRGKHSSRCCATSGPLNKFSLPCAGIGRTNEARLHSENNQKVRTHTHTHTILSISTNRPHPLYYTYIWHFLKHVPTCYKLKSTHTLETHPTVHSTQLLQVFNTQLYCNTVAAVLHCALRVMDDSNHQLSFCGSWQCCTLSNPLCTGALMTYFSPFASPANQIYLIPIGKSAVRFP